MTKLGAAVSGLDRVEERLRCGARVEIAPRDVLESGRSLHQFNTDESGFAGHVTRGKKRDRQVAPNQIQREVGSHRFEGNIPLYVCGSKRKITFFARWSPGGKVREGLLGEIIQAKSSSTCKRMHATQDRRQTIRCEMAPGYAAGVPVLRQSKKPNVNLAPSDRNLEVIAPSNLKCDPHLRVLRVESLQGGGEIHRGLSWNRSNTQPTTYESHSGGRIGRRALSRIKAHAGSFQECDAAGGQLDPTTCAVKQHHTDLILERLDLMTKRGLRDETLRRGAGEAPLLGQSDHVTQLLQFHVSIVQGHRWNDKHVLDSSKKYLEHGEIEVLAGVMRALAPNPRESK